MKETAKQVQIGNINQQRILGDMFSFTIKIEEYWKTLSEVSDREKKL